MSKKNDFLISFYGNINDDITEDLMMVSETNPRLIKTGGVLISIISSSLTVKELVDVFDKNNRLFVIQKVSEDLFVQLGVELNSHLFNKDEDYFVKKLVNLEKQEVLRIDKIDDITKNEIINDLLSKVKNNTITDSEKDILRKLVDDEE